MRAPNSDLKGRVLDDLALGGGGRLFKTTRPEFSQNTEDRVKEDASVVKLSPTLLQTKEG